MKIEIEVSDDNEGTADPWWLIIDPKQMMSPDAGTVAMSMITGPFFSRKEATDELNSRRYAYSSRAVVWCSSGCYTTQYQLQCRKAEEAKRHPSLIHELGKLEKQMATVAAMMATGDDETVLHSEELAGAREMVLDWIEGIKREGICKIS